MQRRDAVRRGLGEPDVARHDCAVKRGAEVLFELRRHVLPEGVSRVVHGAQQPFDLEPRIEVRADLADRLHEIRQPFERVILALHRDQHRIGGAEPVQRQQGQRRRAVEQNES